MLYHLVHRAVLQELSVIIAVLAVIKVRAPVCIRAAILILSERHATTLAELRKLACQQGFLLTGECSLVCLERLRMLVGYEIALGGTIGRLGDAILFQPIRDEFLSEEVRYLSILWLRMIVDVQFASEVETCMFIKPYVSFHTYEADTQRIYDQLRYIHGLKGDNLPETLGKNKQEYIFDTNVDKLEKYMLKKCYICMAISDR